MAPLESLKNLRTVSSLIAAGNPLPPILRGWLLLALQRRINDPGSSLDQLLGLKSRAGGRLSGHSTNPQRDRAVRALIQQQGTSKAQAHALAERIRTHRQRPDPELTLIEAKFGRLPASAAQLDRILKGRTRAQQLDA